MKLTETERRDLAWLGRQETPAWGGLYHPDGKSQDPDVARWCAQGLILPVRHPHGHRHLQFEGGYVLAQAGYDALSPEAPASMKEE